MTRILRYRSAAELDASASNPLPLDVNCLICTPDATPGARALGYHDLVVSGLRGAAIARSEDIGALRNRGGIGARGHGYGL